MACTTHTILTRGAAHRYRAVQVTVCPLRNPHPDPLPEYREREWRAELLRHFLRPCPHFLDPADVEEGLFGEIIRFAVADGVEALDTLFALGVHALFAGELFGD